MAAKETRNDAIPHRLDINTLNSILLSLPVTSQSSQWPQLSQLAEQAAPKEFMEGENNDVRGGQGLGPSAE